MAFPSTSLPDTAHCDLPPFVVEKCREIWTQELQGLPKLVIPNNAAAEQSLLTCDGVVIGVVIDRRPSVECLLRDLEKCVGMAVLI